MNDEDTLRPEYPADLVRSGERGKYGIYVVSTRNDMDPISARVTTRMNKRSNGYPATKAGSRGSGVMRRSSDRICVSRSQPPVKAQRP